MRGHRSGGWCCTSGYGRLVSSVIWLLVFILLYSHCWRTPFTFPTNTSTVNPVVTDGAYEESLTAYVTIHHESGYGPEDDGRLSAMKVFIRSLRASGTKRDIVVLVSSQTRKSSRQLISDEGAIVKEVPMVQGVPNSPCEQWFIKINLWNMVNYKRVLYLDPDTVAVLNLDELFLCGDFCLVFLNWTFFGTGLMVIKPDTVMHDRLRRSLDEYGLDKKITWTDRFRWKCPAAHDQFFLDFFHDMESVSLFDPSKGQSKEERQRLPMYYNMNVMYWYERDSWNLVTFDHYKSVNASVQAHAFSYYSAKPWYWVPALFFIQHHQWQVLRTQLVPEESNSWFLVSRLTMLPLLYYMYQYWLLPRVYSGRDMARRRQTGYGLMKAALTAVGPDWVGIFGGLTISWASGQLLYLTIHNTVASQYAWPTFMLYHILIYYMTIKLIEALTSPTAAMVASAAITNITPSGSTIVGGGVVGVPVITSVGSVSIADDPYNTTVTIWWYQWPLAAEVVSYMLMQLTYTGQGFPVKLVVYYILLCLSAITHVNVTRRFLRAFDTHRLPA